MNAVSRHSEASDLDLDDLESAEDFLEYFDVAYDPAVVHVNRLHILQRFHDYLAHLTAGSEHASDSEIRPLDREGYRFCLSKAYSDFVVSDAITEKVFQVLKRASGIATIPVGAIGRARR